MKRLRPSRAAASEATETLFSPDRTLPVVRLVRDDGRTEQVLATEVETADSFLSRARGLMFRRSIPDDYSLVFRFDDAANRDVHMVFVPFPLDVLWLRDGEVQRKERLSPWTGTAAAEADRLIELPAGSADDVSVGDEVRLEN
jgi:uncharacterized membrane protein (UPF0127 family)